MCSFGVQLHLAECSARWMFEQFSGNTEKCKVEPLSRWEVINFCKAKRNIVSVYIEIQGNIDTFQ